MAYEITTNQTAGLTLTARLVLAGAYVGAAIALSESGTVPGHYANTNNLPGGTAAAVYVVQIVQGSEVIADGLLRWDGAAEVLSASQASVTAIPTTPLLASGYTAPDNASILDIKAKTVALPIDPADASDIAAAFVAVNATLATIAGYVDTEIAAVLAAVDTEVAAIKLKTDNLPADPSSQSGTVLADVRKINNIAVTGAGIAGNAWRPV